VAAGIQSELSDLTADAARALLESATCELARRDLLAFGLREVHDFEDPPHVRLVAQLLERVERGELRRLMVNLPPRHGKSLLCSQVFPAWFLGRNPRRNVIIATHSSELSEKNSRGARALIEDDRWPFDTRLSSDSTAVHRWNLTEGGGLYAIGVGGSVTGRGADLLVLDDIQHDAGTVGEREVVMSWFKEVAIPRLEPNAAIVDVGTRFGEDDVFGRVQEEKNASAWQVVRLPALAEEGDPLGRPIGAALWPARMPVSELEQRREEMGSRAFEAQFQQNPVPEASDLVQLEWFSGRFKTVPSGLRITAALDAAVKTGIANDYSVIAVLGSTQNSYYLLDVIRRRVDFPDLRRMLLSMYETHRPSIVYVEDTANGAPLVQELKRETTLPIRALKVSSSKVARFEAITGVLEAKRVQFPDEAPWLSDFLREILAFPNGRHDDQVDAFTHVLEQAALKRTWSVCSV
jgi:predicted phage terminase large subunit-like protein